MSGPIHILHLEDDQQDAELIQAALVAGRIGCLLTRVQNRTDFMAALDRGGFDLVIADLSLPGFDGLDALEIVRERWPGLPFIIVSGSVGEEAAVELLKRGAMDFLLKDRISRLVPAVHRAVKETADRIERRRLEEQVIQSQKLEVIGQLAAGVAHDFNNILAVIMGYSDLLMQDTISDHQRNYVETIRHAAERAAGLTRQLLIFSRKQTEQAVVLEINKVVAEMEKMLRRLIHENIQLTFALGKETGSAKADAGHVCQVLMNLVVNARDSMPHGGKLIIATSNVTLDASYTRAHLGAKPGDYVMLSVSDTGTGMTDEVKARLFEPFFTTKPKGKGTGLGLATCQTIAKQCGGHIGLHSELGKGTTFKVYFPRVFSPAEAQGDVLRKGPLPCGTETLLLVEDEPAVRDLARAVLESHGYEVLSASNGQDGLELARNRKGLPISLVITDVVMPQMDGKIMTDSLRVTHPDMRILFTSGYTDDAIEHHGVLDPGVAFLPKPYTPATLTRKVREVLDGPHSNVNGTKQEN